MKLGGSDIPFSRLLRSWRTCGELFLYAKMLDESRKPFVPQRDGQRQKKSATPIQIFSRLIDKLINVLYFFVLCVRCGLAPKNRIVIFNHTSRRRMTDAGSKPFYLPAKNFTLESEIIFEDRLPVFSYPAGSIQLSSVALDSFTGLIARFFALYSRLFYGVTDIDVLVFLVKRGFWKVIFRLLKPVRVQVIVWYGKEPLISACKELDIEVWDMQHGIIYPEHPIYNLIEANAVVGSDYLRPNKCLVYGEYWKNLLLQSGWADGEVVVAGYFPDTSVGYPNVCDMPYVLYTSQPHSNMVISEHIESILDELKTRGWLAVIALHPSESADGYDEIISENVRIAKFDSYDLLRNCVAHISYSSTLLWEAMLFEKPSFILRYGNEAVGLLSDLVKFGYGRPLANGEFPVEFELPTTPSTDYFFADVNKTLLNN